MISIDKFLAQPLEASPTLPALASLPPTVPVFGSIRLSSMRGLCSPRSTRPRGSRQPRQIIQPKATPCRVPLCPYQADTPPTTHCSRRARRTRRDCRTGFESCRLSLLQSLEPSSSSSPSRRPHRCEHANPGLIRACMMLFH